ncbi:MAG TPA: hypothetical protein VJZ27_04125, partial [Aggregatilineales bacterium]|nr:hypothetical protein [Aggregatilineales bacterium]
MQNWKERSISADDAATKVKSGNSVFLTGNCSTPQRFIDALCARYEEIREVELVQVLSLGKPLCITPEMSEHLRVNSLFIDPNVRDAVNEGLADFTPVFLSEIPNLFRSGRLVL